MRQEPLLLTHLFDMNDPFGYRQTETKTSNNEHNSDITDDMLQVRRKDSTFGGIFSA